MGVYSCVFRVIIRLVKAQAVPELREGLSEAVPSDGWRRIVFQCL